jgi:uncharacterized repeat protein (TIGR01451 family)
MLKITNASVFSLSSKLTSEPTSTLIDDWRWTNYYDLSVTNTDTSFDWFDVNLTWTWYVETRNTVVNSRFKLFSNTTTTSLKTYANWYVSIDWNASFTDIKVDIDWYLYCGWSVSNSYSNAAWNYLYVRWKAQSLTPLSTKFTSAWIAINWSLSFTWHTVTPTDFYIYSGSWTTGNNIYVWWNVNIYKMQTGDISSYTGTINNIETRNWYININNTNFRSSTITSGYWLTVSDSFIETTDTTDANDETKPNIDISTWWDFVMNDSYANFKNSSVQVNGYMDVNSTYLVSQNLNVNWYKTISSEKVWIYFRWNRDRHIYGSIFAWGWSIWVWDSTTPDDWNILLYRKWSITTNFNIKSYRSNTDTTTTSYSSWLSLYSDPYTVFYSDMNGQNNSTSFYDLSNTSKSRIIAWGWAKVTTTNPKVWLGSLLLNWTGDYLRVPDNSAYDLWTGNFTIDFNFYYSSTATFPKTYFELWAYNNGIMVHQPAAGTFRIYLNWNSYDTVFTPSASTWYHAAIVRNGTQLRLFINWTLMSTFSWTNSNILPAWDFYIWSRTPWTSEFFPWMIDEFRISKWVARWWATNFTPPVINANNGILSQLYNASSVSNSWSITSNWTWIWTWNLIDNDIFNIASSTTTWATYESIFPREMLISKVCLTPNGATWNSPENLKFQFKNTAWTVINTQFIKMPSPYDWKNRICSDLNTFNAKSILVSMYGKDYDGKNEYLWAWEVEFYWVPTTSNILAWINSDIILQNGIYEIWWTVSAKNMTITSSSWKKLLLTQNHNNAIFNIKSALNITSGNTNNTVVTHSVWNEWWLKFVTDNTNIWVWALVDVSAKWHLWWNANSPLIWYAWGSWSNVAWTLKLWAWDGWTSLLPPNYNYIDSVWYTYKGTSWGIWWYWVSAWWWAGWQWWTSLTTWAWFSCWLKWWVAYCWWWNWSYSLGDWTNTHSYYKPVKVADWAIPWWNKWIQKIVASRWEYQDKQHTCVLKDKVVYCWWNNDYYQLWDTTSSTRATPTKVADWDMINSWVDDISVADMHSCALKAGKVYCWWFGNYWQLWIWSNNNSTSPKLVVDWEFDGWNNNITDIYTWWGWSYWYTCALKAWIAYCWWQNSLGQLWLNNQTNYNIPKKVLAWAFSWGNTWWITKLTLTNQANYNTTCALKLWIVYCWWHGLNWQLGNWATSSSNVPVLVSAWDMTNTWVSDISSSATSIIALKNGSVYTWWANWAWQLCTWDTTNYSTPKRILDRWILGWNYGISNITWWGTSQSNAWNISYSRTMFEKDWKFYGCWYNWNWEMSIWTTTNQTSPQMLFNWATQVESCWMNTCMLVNGSAWCWGYNGYWQLWNWTTTLSTVPTKVLDNSWALFYNDSISKLSCGWWNYQNRSHVCALREWIVYCWWAGEWWQLWDGTSTARSIPTKVSDWAIVWWNSWIDDVTSWWLQTCALKWGVVYCWWWNWNWALWDTTSSTKNVPVKTADWQMWNSWVSSIKMWWSDRDWTGDMTCAIKNWILYCWWSNTDNLLWGLGTQYSPVRMPNWEFVWWNNWWITQVVMWSWPNWEARACALQYWIVYCWWDNSWWGLWLWNTSWNNWWVPQKVSDWSIVWWNVWIDYIAMWSMEWYALKDWVLYGWWWNSQWALWDGTTTQRVSPVKVWDGSIVWWNSGITYITSWWAWFTTTHLIKNWIVYWAWYNDTNWRLWSNSAATLSQTWFTAIYSAAWTWAFWWFSFDLLNSGWAWGWGWNLWYGWYWRAACDGANWNADVWNTRWWNWWWWNLAGWAWTTWNGGWWALACSWWWGWTWWNSDSNPYRLGSWWWAWSIQADNYTSWYGWNGWGLVRISTNTLTIAWKILANWDIWKSYYANHWAGWGWAWWSILIRTKTMTCASWQVSSAGWNGGAWTGSILWGWWWWGWAIAYYYADTSGSCTSSVAKWTWWANGWASDWYAWYIFQSVGTTFDTQKSRVIIEDSPAEANGVWAIKVRVYLLDVNWVPLEWEYLVAEVAWSLWTWKINNWNPLPQTDANWMVEFLVTSTVKGIKKVVIKNALTYTEIQEQPTMTFWVPNIVIEKTANKTSVNSWDVVTYTITVTNNGTWDAGWDTENAIIVEDVLPTWFTYYTTWPTAWSKWYTSTDSTQYFISPELSWDWTSGNEQRLRYTITDGISWPASIPSGWWKVMITFDVKVP